MRRRLYRDKKRGYAVKRQSQIVFDFFLLPILFSFFHNCFLFLVFSGRSWNTRLTLPFDALPSLLFQTLDSSSFQSQNGPCPMDFPNAKTNPCKKGRRGAEPTKPRLDGVIPVSRSFPEGSPPKPCNRTPTRDSLGRFFPRAFSP